MSHRKFLVAVVVVLLLATFVTPALAESPAASPASLVQPTTWSAPVKGFIVFPPGIVQPNGGCEDGGNGSC